LLGGCWHLILSASGVSPKVADRPQFRGLKIRPDPNILKEHAERGVSQAGRLIGDRACQPIKR
jgi:hypothetical protein